MYLGLDLSQTDDNTSLAMVTKEGDTVYAKVWGFIPENKIDIKSHKEGVDYAKLIREKNCFACGDDVIDYGFVERFIQSLCIMLTAAAWGSSVTPTRFSSSSV